MGFSSFSSFSCFLRIGEMKTDQKLGLALLIFCLIMWFLIIPNQVMGKAQSLFPRIITIFIGIPSFLLIISRKDSPKETPFGLEEKKGITRVTITAIIFFIYIFIIDFLGYFISSFLASLAFMLYFGARNWKKTIVIPVMLLLFIYFLIEKLLGFPLPSGIIF